MAVLEHGCLTPKNNCHPGCCAARSDALPTRDPWIPAGVYPPAAPRADRGTGMTKIGLSSSVHPRQFGFLGWREIECGGARKLRFRLISVARIGQRLAPFEMQPAPVG